jgi:hypothetical protein
MQRVIVGRTLSGRAKAIGFDETEIFKMKIPSLSILPKQVVEMTFIRIRISNNTWAEPAAA